MPRSPDKIPSPASPHGAAIALLQQHSLNTLVQRELERQIVSGRLASGAKLNEAEIAGELGVSRGPVREAFRALEQAGLVRTEKNRGVFVRRISLDEANELYEVRAALDGLIGRLAAKRITPALIARARAIVKRMHAVGRTRDFDAYYPLNVAFHEVLAEAARNRALFASHRRVVNELHLFQRETLVRSAETIPISTQHHEAIVDAVAKGDAALAERLLVEHAIRSRERLRLAWQQPPVRRAKSVREAA